VTDLLLAVTQDAARLPFRNEARSASFHHAFVSLVLFNTPLLC
jgi:hypothetical protein